MIGNGGNASRVLTEEIIATREKTLAAHLDGETRKDVEAVFTISVDLQTTFTSILIRLASERRLPYGLTGRSGSSRAPCSATRRTIEPLAAMRPATSTRS